MTVEPSADQLIGPGRWLVDTETSALRDPARCNGGWNLGPTRRRGPGSRPEAAELPRPSPCSLAGMALRSRLLGLARRTIRATCRGGRRLGPG